MTDTNRIRELERRIMQLEGQLKDAWTELNNLQKNCEKPALATWEECKQCKNLAFAFDGRRMCNLSRKAIE